MTKVIGVGLRGCSVASQFDAYPEYRIYSFTNQASGLQDFEITPQDNIELYEKNFDTTECSVYLRSIRPEDEVLVFVEGGDPLGGCLLKLLGTIRESTITVVYLVPDLDTLTKFQLRDNQITFKILQEYARSGAIHDIYLISLPILESLVGEVPIGQYENSLWYLLSYTIATRIYFNKSNPIFSTYRSPPPGARIKTMGVSSFPGDRDDVTWLYPVKDALTTHLFYGVPLAQSTEDVTLMTQIKTHASANSLPGISSFSVYNSSQEKIISIGLVTTATIQ
jgi:hypothetical protein